jgi:hypothetical protein
MRCASHRSTGGIVINSSRGGCYYNMIVIIRDDPRTKPLMLVDFLAS